MTVRSGCPSPAWRGGWGSRKGRTREGRWLGLGVRAEEEGKAKFSPGWAEQSRDSRGDTARDQWKAGRLGFNRTRTGPQG